jgi:hypothetical protein
MEEGPENGKESSHSAHANGMNEWMNNSSCQRLQWRLEAGQDRWTLFLITLPSSQHNWHAPHASHHHLTMMPAVTHLWMVNFHLCHKARLKLVWQLLGFTSYFKCQCIHDFCISLYSDGTGISIVSIYVYFLNSDRWNVYWQFQIRMPLLWQSSCMTCEDDVISCSVKGSLLQFTHNHTVKCLGVLNGTLAF